MIRRVFIVRNDGDLLYAKIYDEDAASSNRTIPPHALACVMLFSSNSSTALGELYTQNQEDNRWAYMFFNSFAVVVLTTSDEENPHLKKRMMSLGRAISTAYSGIMASWSGDMSQIADMESLVGSYVSMEIGSPSEELAEAIGSLVDANLEAQTVAYVGVFDAAGNLIHGTVPESHVTVIRSEISRGIVKPGVDVVPTGIAIEGHEVFLTRVRSYTVVAASYRDEGRLSAIKAVSEVAQSLEALVHEEPRAPKKMRGRRKT
ncbi:MAG: hypothetical protein C4K47_09325 [Candidatus Thorarchaeota archaeon]|nr:MAG: hypothetical protein C4K47_09325 [Candidatus Thorarchaeota archaeon]